MDKALRHILVVIACLVLFYLFVGLAASVSQLADGADRVHHGMGQPVFWGLTTIFLFFVVSPFVLYFKLPAALIPPVEISGSKHDEYMIQLRNRLIKNPRVKGAPLDSDEDVVSAISILSTEANKIITQTASTVFVGTAVMQNGRLDGLITLLTQARMVWQIATIYNQRPSPRQMLYLYSNVGATALLAQSIDDIDFSEIVAPIVVSAIPSLKGAVPGLQGISSLLVNSLSNGAANAMLTLRVGFVARQYCEAISAPSRQIVRKNATVAALAMIGKIAQENSIHILKNSWDAVSGLTGDAVDATVQGIKSAAGYVSDSTVAGVKHLGGVLDSTVEGVKNGVTIVADSSVTGVKALGGALDSTMKGVKNGAGKASESAIMGVKAFGGMIDSTVQSVKVGTGKITSRQKVE
jgi:hypothetical protein